MSKKNRDQAIDQDQYQSFDDESVEEQDIEQSGLSDEEKKARKAAANKRWAERRKEARPRVVQFLKDNKEQLGAIYDDLALFVAAAMREPKAKVEKGPSVPSINAELKARLLEGPISELEVFRQFHIGRPEMKLKIRAFILTPKTEDRIWVAFDEKEEAYSIVGTGTDAPEGWTGYLPKDKDKADSDL